MCGVIDPHAERPDKSVPPRLCGLELAAAELTVVATGLVQPLLQARQVDVTQATLHCQINIVNPLEHHSSFIVLVK